MKFKCIRDVVMNADGRVAFKTGEEYEFNMNANGEISCPVPNGQHFFLAHGEDAWPTYFVHELEADQ